jgi:hypothetical protein
MEQARISLGHQHSKPGSQPVYAAVAFVQPDRHVDEQAAPPRPPFFGRHEQRDRADDFSGLMRMLVEAVEQIG